jgi:hypothetical protein
MVQGKIERYHRSMKNCFLLENYYLLGHLEERIRGMGPEVKRRERAPLSLGAAAEWPEGAVACLTG